MNQLNIKKFHNWLSENFFVFIILSFLYSKNVSAYIDPGTGGMIIGSSGSIIGAILAVIVAIIVEYFFNPVRKLILKIWNLFSKKEGS